MDTNRRNRTINNSKFELSKQDNIDHWLNFAFIIIFLGIPFYAIISESEGLNKIAICGILVLLLLLFLRHKLNSLNLSKHNLKLTSPQFKSANSAAAKLNDWIVVSNQNKYFEAIRKCGWQWEGIKIVSILDKDNVYLNSMISPAINSNPFSFGIIAKNKRILLEQYRKVKSGKEVNKIADRILIRREEEFWNESELSAKNLLMKIVAYPIGIGLSILAIYLISSLEPKAILYGAITLGLIGTYFYYDWKVIIEKRKRRKSKQKPGYNTR